MIHRVLEQFELIGLFLLCALNILNAGLNLVEEHERVVGVIAGRGGRPHDDVVGDVDLHAGEECLLVVLEVAREALESLLLDPDQLLVLLAHSLDCDVGDVLLLPEELFPLDDQRHLQSVALRDLLRHRGRVGVVHHGDDEVHEHHIADDHQRQPHNPSDFLHDRGLVIVKCVITN